jgi:hypothetical protein
MAYNDAQKKQAIENKVNRAISFEVMEELRLLTGLSVRKLITHINAARGKVKSIDDETIYDFDPRSRSALYRDFKKEQTKQVSHLTGTTLKKDEGQLRIRIIEIPIYYGKNPEQKCEPNEIEKYEILRWLFCYETNSGYLSYKEIPMKSYPPTLGFIMNYIESIQTELKIPFSMIIFTQNLFNNEYDDNSVMSWDWVNSSLMRKSWTTFDYQKMTNIEQLDCPARNHMFSLNGIDEKTKFMKTVRQLVNKHKSSINKKQQVCSAAYEKFIQELDVAKSKGESERWHVKSDSDSRILFNSIVSDKKFRKLKELIDKEEEDKKAEILNNLKRFI